MQRVQPKQRNHGVRLVLRLLFVGFLTWLVGIGAGVGAGCGSGPGTIDRGNGGSGGGTGGTIQTARYEVPAGQTRIVTSDLTVKATDAIVIAGTLQIAEGVNVALMSEKDLTISGTVETVDATRARAGQSRQVGAPGPQFVFGAIHTSMTGSVYVRAHIIGYVLPPTGTMTITGYIKGKDGMNARNRFENGEDGIDIDIGTDRGNTIAASLGVAAARPARVTISGSGIGGVYAGNGGHGFDDDTGEPQGKDLTLTGTNGGKGGYVAVAAGDIDATGTVFGGDGGQAARAASLLSPGRKTGPRWARRAATSSPPAATAGGAAT